MCRELSLPIQNIPLRLQEITFCLDTKVQGWRVDLLVQIQMSVHQAVLSASHQD